MSTETLLSDSPPLWKSQLARWLRQESRAAAETRTGKSRTPRAPQPPEHKPVFAPSPPPVWPRVFPGL